MKTKILASDFALVRRPILPLQTLIEWQSSKNSEQFILDQFNDPLVSEALFIASPSLYERLQEWHRGEGEARRHSSERKKFISSLAKYISRAAYRCTPFGLFAQVQLATHSDSKNAQFDRARRRIQRGIHLDNGVEAKLIEKALANLDWREKLSWQINNTSFLVGSNLSYVDWIYQEGKRTYRSVELALNEAITTLKLECQAPRPFLNICTLLVDSLDVSLDEAKEFLHLTIDRRLLTPDLAPSFGDQCSIDALFEKVAPHPATDVLRDVQAELHQLREKSTSPASLVSHYQTIQALVEHALEAKSTKSSVVQVDSADQQPIAIDQDMMQSVVQLIELLIDYNAQQSNSFVEYKRVFRERFEDREVNLAYALHHELGVPFPNKAPLNSPLIDGLQLHPGGTGSHASTNINAFGKFIIERLFDAAGKGENIIAINAADLEKISKIEEKNSTLAEGLYAHVSVFENMTTSNSKIEFKGMGGRSGLELIGRFAHLSPQIHTAALAYHAQNNQRDPDVIYAEIVHHPQDRMLNILRRPTLGNHQIVFAGSSDLPRENQIWIEDLSIRLERNQFILRCRRTGKQVKPRLTSAHNYSNRQIGVYHFLASLQNDESAWCDFNWPNAVQDLAHLPRVEINGIVVARERWILKKDEISTLNHAAIDNNLEAWRSKHKLPRFVTFDQHDNHLPVDLNNPASVNLLIDEIIKLSEVRLFECLSLNGLGPSATGTQHNQEWILPFKLIRDEIGEKTSRSRSKLDELANLRNEGHICPNLENWVYLKMYTGSGYADRLMREFVGPVMQAAIQTAAIDKWFFVRYQDQFEHLRLRFRSDDKNCLVQTLIQIQAALAKARDAGLLWRVVSDDYILETERYGGLTALSVCEELFRIDSEDLLVLLDIEANDETSPGRWLFALASLDLYGQLLCPEILAREKLFEELAKGYLDEFSAASRKSSAQVALGARFRDMRKKINLLDEGSGSIAIWLNYLRNNSHHRQQLISRLQAQIHHLHEEQQQKLFQSLLHMHCNRFSPSDPRRHETVLYDFVRRIERARQARKRPARDTNQRDILQVDQE